jgi:DNA repair exonuclease SbcCD ATPase subunit
VLELLDLQFSGIGRFVEEQSIDFSALNAFIQVDGQNNNTGGSSGSGKSTVFNALDYLLGLNDLPSTILQSRLTEDHLTVTGSFLWNGKPLSITRGKKLKINIDGKTIEGSSALTEEKLNDILGMPGKIFRKLLHKRQKEGGFFLDFTPQKMYEFLIDCLNLTEHRKNYEKIDQIIKDLTAKLVTEKSLLDGQQIGLNTTRESIESFGPPPVKDVYQDTVLSLKKKMDEAEINLRAVLKNHEFETNNFYMSRPEYKIVPFDSTELNFHTETLKGVENTLKEFEVSEKDRISKVRQWMATNDMAIERNAAIQEAGKKAHEESMRLAADIKQIRSSICPTCEQNWSTESSKQKEKEKLDKILQLKIVMDAGAQAFQDRIVLDKNTILWADELVTKTHPDIETIKHKMRYHSEKIAEERKKESEWLAKQNAVNQTENEKFASLQKALDERQRAEANQARGQLDLDRRVFDGAISRFRAYEEAKSKYDSNLSMLKAKEEKFTKTIEEIQKNIAKISDELILAEETNRAIKTFLNYSFDEALEAIGIRSTEIIRCIPNMKNATIRFDGTKETQKGIVKEEVNAVIGMDGEVSVPIKSLCGGERSAADISVDLAVIDYIETKSGKGINIFILDEPFTGLGPVEIEMALEVLKNSNTNKKIVIVDHNSEVKQMVQNRLLVVRDGLTSNIENNTL